MKNKKQTDAELLKETRKKLGLTQAQMAEKIGYSDRSNTAHVEAGRKGLSASARKIVEMLA